MRDVHSPVVLAASIDAVHHGGAVHNGGLDLVQKARDRLPGNLQDMHFLAGWEMKSRTTTKVASASAVGPAHFNLAVEGAPGSDSSDKAAAVRSPSLPSNLRRKETSELLGDTPLAGSSHELRAGIADVDGMGSSNGGTFNTARATPGRAKSARTLTSSRTTGIAAAAPGNVARFLRKQLSRSSSSGTSTAEGSRTEFGARVTPLPAEQSTQRPERKLRTSRSEGASGPFPPSSSANPKTLKSSSTTSLRGVRRILSVGKVGGSGGIGSQSHDRGTGGRRLWKTMSMGSSSDFPSGPRPQGKAEPPPIVKKEKNPAKRVLAKLSSVLGSAQDTYPHSEDPDKAWQVLEPLVGLRQIDIPDPMDTGAAPGFLKVVCISDTHGTHASVQVPDGDILIHAGDFTKTGEKAEVEDFNAWLGALPHTHKIVIAGNHEITFDTSAYHSIWRRYHKMKRDATKIKASLTNCIYLEDSGIAIGDYYFYGSPWQPKFNDWGFNKSRGKSLRQMWEKIPDHTDILITHGPPIGAGDQCRSGKRAGCVDLLYHVQRRVSPAYHIYGHVHEGFGMWTDEVTTYVNASTCTHQYKPCNRAIVFDLPPKAQREGALSPVADEDEGIAMPVD